MEDHNRERVLCIKREDLPAPWVMETAVVKMTDQAFFGAMTGVPFCWLPRDEAEHNTDYKQLIPYVLFQTADGLYTACYCRTGTEERLHRLCSVGVGGHINPMDGEKGDGSFSALVESGMKREIGEEFQSPSTDLEPVFHGIINEEKTAVGHVHLGLVYRVHVWDRESLEPGEELSEFGWIETDRVFQKPLELWSRLALNLLKTALE